MEFYVIGKVVPKQSFRFSYRGGYTSNRVKLYANRVRESFESGYPNWIALKDIPFKIKIDIFFKVPKGNSRKLNLRCLEGKIRPLKRPDIDNVSKNILDALNGIVYVDDKQIVELTIRKYYGEQDYVRINIDTIKEEL